MKRWMCFACLFSLLAGWLVANESAKMAEEIAPFVNEHTVLVAGFGPSVFDIDKLESRILEYMKRSMTVFAFDDDSVRRTMAEGEPLIREMLQTLRDEMEKSPDVERFYFVLSLEDEAHTVLAVLPAAGLSKEEKEEVMEEESDIPLFYADRGDYIVGCFTGDMEATDEDRAALTEYLDDFTAKERPELLEALNDWDGRSAWAVALPGKGIQRWLKSMQEDSEEMAPVLNAAGYMALKTKWILCEIDPMQPGFNIVLQANNRSSARQIAMSLEGLIDLGTTAIHTFMKLATTMDESSGIDLPPEYFSLMAEMARGGMRMLLPKQEGDRLIWKYQIDPETLTVEQSVFVGVGVLFGAGFAIGTRSTVRELPMEIEIEEEE